MAMSLNRFFYIKKLIFVVPIVSDVERRKTSLIRLRNCTVHSSHERHPTANSIISLHAHIEYSRPVRPSGGSESAPTPHIGRLSVK